MILAGNNRRRNICQIVLPIVVSDTVTKHESCNDVNVTWSSGLIDEIRLKWRRSEDKLQVLDIITFPNSI